LEAVRVRDYFSDEARDFAPWLSSEEGIELLGEVIGMNLELVGTERRVGPYRVDIVAKEGDQTVVVENQLDGTDHRHLGQLLVYAAGHDADVVVWVARQVTDEHRAVLDWLNAETKLDFWALEFELWKIGGSSPAPKLNVVCEPNVLARTSGGEEGEELSELSLLQLEFWKQLSSYLEESDAPFNARKPQSRHWYDLRLGTRRAHISLGFIRSAGRVSVELYMPNDDAKHIFNALLSEKQAIEATLGELDWQLLPERRACRIIKSRPAALDDRDAWPGLTKWLIEQATLFHAAFADRVKQVDMTGASSPTSPTQSAQLTPEPLAAHKGPAGDRAASPNAG
jgi:hypothetical protein